ncbi:MAG: hypothetical protein MZV63_62995 [Marinilabiliales bacterium]|nr:hypothetical protein [Marinilabiliales bacterium]
MKTLKVGGRRQDLGKYRTGAASLYQAYAEVGPRRRPGRVGGDRDPQPAADGRGPRGGRSQAAPHAEKATLARYVRENGTDYCQGCARMPPGLPRPASTRRAILAGARLPRELRQDGPGPGGLAAAYLREQPTGRGLPRLRRVREGLPLRRRRCGPGSGKPGRPPGLTGGSRPGLRSARA